MSISMRTMRSVLWIATMLINSTLAVAQQASLPVFVFEVKPDRFVDRLEALGSVRANEAVTLTATVSDTVSAIHFQDGQRVKAGTVLVEMTSAEEHAQLEEARSTVEEALRQYERVQTLRLSGTSPESLLDQRRREYETAQARLHAIQSRLQDRLIIAPFHGIVGLRNISIGALVEPGDVITTLDDDSIMKLDFSVPSTYLEALKPGLPIIAKARALNTSVFEGEISSVNFRIDPATRSVQVRALLPNPEKKLRPGLLMSIELLKNPRDALVIPEEAIVSEGRQHFIFLVDCQSNPAVAHKREVKLGGRRPGQVEVLDGLQNGDWVITHGTILVRDGSPVNVRAQDHNNRPLADMLRSTEPKP